MESSDLDDFVLGIVEAACSKGRPIEYAVGPLSDRRVRQQFHQHNLRVPKDRLCASINRLVASRRLSKIHTGDTMVGSGGCLERVYPVVALMPA